MNGISQTEALEPDLLRMLRDQVPKRIQAPLIARESEVITRRQVSMLLACAHEEQVPAIHAIERCGIEILLENTTKGSPRRANRRKAARHTIRVDQNESRLLRERRALEEFKRIVDAPNLKRMYGHGHAGDFAAQRAAEEFAFLVVATESRWGRSRCRRRACPTCAKKPNQRDRAA